MTAVGGELGINTGGDEAQGIAVALHVLVEGGVAGDHTLEVAEFVEDRGEQIVVSVGIGARGGGGGVVRGLDAEFGVFPGGGVDEPAEAVTVEVKGEGAGIGATE